MLMSTSPPATSQPDQDCKEMQIEPSLPSFERAPNVIRQRNAQESPLLNLPAELRNRIYEFVIGGHFIHIEAEDKEESCSKPRALDPSAFGPLPRWQPLQLKRWHDTKCLHYYPCTAVPEREAYERFLDASVLELLPGDDESFANNWRLGNKFHVLSCKERHAKCLPRDDDRKPDWMKPPVDRSRPAASSKVTLSEALDLALLRTCFQIYQEAKHMPFSTNTFSVRDVMPFTLLPCKLGFAQARDIRSIHVMWRLGEDQERWLYWLTAPNISSVFAGVRHLHLSLLIAHAGMGDDGPYRDDFFDGRISLWLSGLDQLRALPLTCVTVMLSDDPDSRYGVRGYSNPALRYGWRHTYDLWLEMREEECLTAEEKRRWAQLLRSYLLNETSELVLR